MPSGGVMWWPRELTWTTRMDLGGAFFAVAVRRGRSNLVRQTCPAGKSDYLSVSRALGKRFESCFSVPRTCVPNWLS